MVMLGAAAAVLDRSHFALDLFDTGASERAQQILKSIINLAVLGLSLILAVNGWTFLLSGFKRVSLITGLPLAWTYSSFFFAGVLMSIFAALLLFGWSHRRHEQGGELPQKEESENRQ